ncbi:MAG: ATP synthase F0 subunit B [Desulfovibrionaceae bacterium]
MAAHEEGGEAHHVPWMNFILRVVNFALVLGILWWAAGKKIVGFFGGRRRQIREDLDDLTSRQAEAQKKLKEVERSIANLEQEKQAILDQAKAQGDALKNAIIEKAKRDAEGITAQAKRTAENEAKAALDQMRAQMADMVVEAAEKLVKSKLTGKDHDKLVDDYLTKVVLN